MENTNSELLNIKQASSSIGVNPGTIRRWALTNTLKGMKVGSRGDWRFTKEELLKLVKDNHDNRLSRKQEAGSRKQEKYSAVYESQAANKTEKHLPDSWYWRICWWT